MRREEGRVQLWAWLFIAVLASQVTLGNHLTLCDILLCEVDLLIMVHTLRVVLRISS